MTTKRKLDQGYGDDISSMSTRLKSVNIGETVDAARKTQMLFQFGQQIQLQQSKDTPSTQYMPFSASCSQCKASFCSPGDMCCNHCTKDLCKSCQLQCCCCGNQFCSTCSIFDYSEYETRSVCFDCSR